MIVQEERQRTVNSQAPASVSSNDMAFAVKNDTSKDNFSTRIIATNREYNRGGSNSRGVGNNRNDFNFRGIADKNRFHNLSQNRERPLHSM